MIRGIHHTAISVPDLGLALKFYCDLLGFEKVFKFKWPAGTKVSDDITGLKGSAARAVMLRKGNAHVELFEYESPAPKPCDPERPVCDHGYTHLCIDVIDIDSEYERLKAGGMEFHCPPRDMLVVKATYGRDPFGNVIELQEIIDENLPIALKWE
jgi:catechol 2,3-dioxygenase-like lactoylglutathione lyase family enzyme